MKKSDQQVASYADRVWHLSIFRAATLNHFYLMKVLDLFSLIESPR